MYHVGWLEVILCFAVMGIIITWRHAPDTVCLRSTVPDTSVRFNLPYLTCDVPIMDKFKLNFAVYIDKILDYFIIFRTQERRFEIGEMVLE